MSRRSGLLSAIAPAARMSAEDVARLRSVIYRDATISAEIAEALFQINNSTSDAPKEWCELFVQALTDYAVRQAHPKGYVDPKTADWLAARIVSDGRMKSATELELLVRIMEEAVVVPPQLVALTFSCVEAHAMSGSLGSGERATLTVGKVRFVARLIYAVASDGAMAVSRPEAELLFRLNDATRGRPNHPAWQELFANAVAASLLTASGYKPPDRDEALRQLGPLSIPSTPTPSSIVGLIRMGRRLHAIAKEDAREVKELADKARAKALAEELDDEEATWLVGQIGRDGQLDENEIAALQLVVDHAPSVPELLRPLLANAGMNSIR